MIFASVPVLQPPDEMKDTAYSWASVGAELLIVDNTTDGAWREQADRHGWSYITFGKNVGVPAAWNIARAWFFQQTERETDLLLLFSASIRWDDGLATALDQFSLAANWKGCQCQWGPHAIAWSRRLLALAGTWDENYWPGYYSDNSYFYRGILDGWLLAGPDAFPQIEVNSPTPEDGRATTRTGLISQTRACRDYYVACWGGEPSHETFTSPFDSGLPTWWWSPCVRPGMEHVNLGESQYR